MAEIGEPVKEVEFEEIPTSVPVEEPSPVVEPAKEREPVPA